MRRPARAAPAPAGAQPRPGAAAQPDHPFPPVAPRPQPPGPARRAGQRAGRQVRGSGIGIGAQQHGSRPPRSRQHDPATTACAARGSSCCRLPGPELPRNPDRSYQRERHHERHEGASQRRDWHRAIRAHGVVAHRTGDRPPARVRHAHPERRQPASTSSLRKSPNNRVGLAPMGVCGRRYLWPTGTSPVNAAKES